MLVSTLYETWLLQPKIYIWDTLTESYLVLQWRKNKENPTTNSYNTSIGLYLICKNDA